MSAGPIQGQATITGDQIRAMVEEIEAGAWSVPEHVKPLERIAAAAEVVRLAEELLAEQVAQARAIEADYRVRPVTESGEWVTEPQGRRPNKNVYGWDVIGLLLKMTGERARQKFGTR